MRYFSVVAGSGVHGRDTGIAHKAIIQVGSIIKEFHLFIERFPQTGETTTDIIVGEDVNGITNEHITVMFSETGRNGSVAGIGKIKTIGGCMI